MKIYFSTSFGFVAMFGICTCALELNHISFMDRHCFLKKCLLLFSFLKVKKSISFSNSNCAVKWNGEETSGSYFGTDNH